MIGVTVRTLHNWEQDAELPIKPMGRPPRPQCVRWRALLACRRVLGKHGWSLGERTVSHILQGAIPIRLIRECLKRLKAYRRARLDRAAAQRRTSIQVLCTGVIFAQDATQLGRDLDDSPVLAELLSDPATTEVVHAEVGPPATAEDVVAFLEHVRATRGLPLVRQNDNGSSYKAKVAQNFLDEHQVLMLLNLPHTPKHNPSAEHANRELQELTGLGKGKTTNTHHAARAVAHAIPILNHRPRRSRGWKSAKEAHAELPPWYTRTSRERFYNDARRALDEVANKELNHRARRLAEREAIFATLESHGLIKRTRGGRPLSEWKSEILL